MEDKTSEHLRSLGYNCPDNTENSRLLKIKTLISRLKVRYILILLLQHLS